MDRYFVQALEKLATGEWDISVRQTIDPLPTTLDLFSSRYSWVPTDLAQLLSELKSAIHKEQKAWLLAADDFLGISDSAFAWDQWEKDSLNAAQGVSDWIDSIKAFWNDHLPIFQSVKNGYSYLALRKLDLRIVFGEEPEYESTTAFAESYLDMLSMLDSKNGLLERLI